MLFQGPGLSLSASLITMKKMLFGFGLLVGVCSQVFAQDAVLRVGDQIEVRLAGVPAEDSQQVTGSYPVDGKGFVNMPHIGILKAAGLTQGALQKSIEGSYRSQQIYSNPTIIVNIPSTARFVNVSGDVKSPQRIPFTADLTVMSAITAAGGFSEYGNPSKVRLTSEGKVTTLDLKGSKKTPPQDRLLKPGDSIEVTRSFF